MKLIITPLEVRFLTFMSCFCIPIHATQHNQPLFAPNAEELSMYLLLAEPVNPLIHPFATLAFQRDLREIDDEIDDLKNISGKQCPSKKVQTSQPAPLPRPHTTSTSPCSIDEHYHNIGLTPLMHAVKIADYEGMRLIAAQGADLFAQNSNGTTALMMAAEQGDIRATNIMLNQLTAGQIRQLLKISDKNGFTALMYAATQLHASTVALLAKNGSPFDYLSNPSSNSYALSPTNTSVLTWAALTKQSFPVLRLLIEQQNQHLSKNALRERRRLVRLLIKHKPTVSECKRTADEQMIMILLDPSIGKVPSHHFLLKLALEYNDLSTARYLLNNGADPNGSIGDSCTVLRWALNANAVQLLFEAGADIDIPQRRFSQTELDKEITGDIYNFYVRISRDHFARANTLIAAGAIHNANDHQLYCKTLQAFKSSMAKAALSRCHNRSPIPTTDETNRIHRIFQGMRQKLAWLSRLGFGSCLLEPDAPTLNRTITKGLPRIPWLRQTFSTILKEAGELRKNRSNVIASTMRAITLPTVITQGNNVREMIHSIPQDIVTLVIRDFDGDTSYIPFTTTRSTSTSPPPIKQRRLQ